MNSTRINTDIFDPDNIDGTYTPEAKVNTSSQHNDSPKSDKNGRNNSNTKTKVSTVKEKKRGRISTFFHDRRTRLFAGITLIFIGCYLTLATVSYFSHGADDQSSATSLSVSEMASSGEVVENAGGPLGASISHNMFSYGFGVGSLVIIYYFFALGWKLLHRRRFNFLGMTLRCLIIMISASVVVGYATYGLRSWIYWGGVHGYEVCKYLFSIAGAAGPLVVSCILVGLIVSIYLNYIRLAIVKYRRMRIAHRLKVEAQKAAKRAEQQLMEETFRSSDNEIEPVAETQPEDAPDESDNMSFFLLLF